jgi:hypothetical protein
VSPTISFVAIENSRRRSRMGMKSLAAWDMAIYSASVVLSTISVCSLEDHKTGVNKAVEISVSG